MLPKTHFLIGLIFAIFLYLVFKITLFEALIIFLASFLIDFDHYIYYVYEKKNFGIGKAYKWFRIKAQRFKKLSKEEKKKNMGEFSCFHGLEWIIAFIFLGYFVSNYFYFISIGMFLHLILDWIEIGKNGRKLHKISAIKDFLIINKLKKVK